MDCPVVILILFMPLQSFSLGLQPNYSFSKENDISESHEYATVAEYDIAEEEGNENIRSSRSVNDDFKSKVSTSETFLQEHLEATNKYRALHRAPELELDYKLAFEAETYAKHLASKSDSDGKPYLKPSWEYSVGETIFAVYSTTDTVTGKQVADNWYNGCKDHDWTDNFFSKKSSRFSQLVWKETKKMGIGKALATKPKGMVIAVARYSPAGNWGYRKSFTENVFPLKGMPEKCEVVPTGRSLWNFYKSPGSVIAGSNGTTGSPNAVGQRGRSLMGIVKTTKKSKETGQSSKNKQTKAGNQNDKMTESQMAIDRQKKKASKEKKRKKKSKKKKDVVIKVSGPKPENNFSAKIF